MYALFFLFLLKNLDYGYSLEPPRRGGSNEYPQSMFWTEIWNFYLKTFSFLWWNFQYIWIGVFSYWALLPDKIGRKSWISVQAQCYVIVLYIVFILFVYLWLLSWAFTKLGRVRYRYKPQGFFIFKLVWCIWTVTSENVPSDVRPTKTQVSLRIRAVWLESSLSSIQNVPSEDSTRMCRLIWIFAVLTCPNVRFLTLRLRWWVIGLAAIVCEKGTLLWSYSH